MNLTLCTLLGDICFSNLKEVLFIYLHDKKLSYCKGTAQSAASDEIFALLHNPYE